MQLLELFDKHLPTRWSPTGAHDVVASFTTPNGQKIYVDFQAESETAYEVSFHADDADADNVYDLSGKGEQYVILTTVIHAINTFIEDHEHVNEIMFSSKGDSRSSAYDRMLRRSLPHGWRISNRIPEGDTVYYTLTRKDG